MSYHEHELDRYSVSVSYGVTLSSWSLPLEIGIGGSGVYERGFNIGFLCFWFALHWWPRDYAVPEHARTGDGSEDWFKRFSPDRDFGYQLEAADISAAEITAMALRLRNSVDLLRELHNAKSPDTTGVKK